MAGPAPASLDLQRAGAGPAPTRVGAPLLRHYQPAVFFADAVAEVGQRLLRRLVQHRAVERELAAVAGADEAVFLAVELDLALQVRADRRQHNPLDPAAALDGANVNLFFLDFLAAAIAELLSYQHWLAAVEVGDLAEVCRQRFFGKGGVRQQRGCGSKRRGGAEEGASVSFVGHGRSVRFGFLILTV